MSSLDQLVDQYLEYLKQEKKASSLTIRNYTHYLNRFLNFLKKHFPTLVYLEAMNQNVIQRYKSYLIEFVDQKGNHLNPNTQGYHFIALRSFLRYLILKGFSTLNLELIDVPHGKSMPLKFLDNREIEMLLRLPNNLRDKSIMELLLSTGLRVSDLVKLNKKNVDFTNREVVISASSGGYRTIFFSETTGYWLKKYLGGRNDNEIALFIREAGKKDAPLRLTVRSIQRILEKYVKKAGIQIKATPSTFRHTFAINLMSSGENIKTIQKLLGHKNISTTQIYTHVTNPQLREIHKRFHRIT